MTDHITDEDGRTIDVSATGENYSIVVFDENGLRITELDRDMALRFARDLFVAALDALNQDD